MNQPGKNGLKIVRHLKASKDQVFGAFSNPDAFAQWWGPAGMPVTVKAFEFKKNGKLHYKMEGNGQVMWGIINFGTITPTDSLEFVNSFSDEEGNICKSPFPMDFPLEIFNLITLEEKGDITILTIEGHPINATAAQEATYHSIKANMEQGFGGTFDQLEAYLARN